MTDSTKLATPVKKVIPVPPTSGSAAATPSSSRPKPKASTTTPASSSSSSSTSSSTSSTLGIAPRSSPSPIPVTGSLASLPSGFESLYDDDTEEMSLDYTTMDYTEEWGKEQTKVSQYGYDDDTPSPPQARAHERDLIPGVPSFILTRPLDLTIEPCTDLYTHGIFHFTHPAWSHVTTSLVLQQITRQHVMRQHEAGTISSRPQSGNGIPPSTSSTITSSLGYAPSTLVLRKLTPEDGQRSITEMHWGGHVLQIVVRHAPTSTSTSTTASLPSMSFTHGRAHDIISIDYLFNGDRYRHVIRDTEMGYFEDNNRIHGATWQRCAWWLQQLLIPLGLGSQGRRGWIAFYEQCIPWEKCGMCVQHLRTIYDVHRLN